MNYGKYGPGSDPAQSPSMSEQIRSMARYIKERYGNPTAALAFHNAHNWYGEGGMLAQAAATAPTLGGPLPAVNPSDAITPGSRGDRDAKGRKKKKKAKKRVVAASGAPGNLQPVTVGRSKAKLPKIKRPKVSQKVRELIGQLKTGKLEDVAELARAIALEQDIDTRENLYAAMEGRFGLTDEYPTVIMEDTEDYQDFTNYLRNNPGALRGAKNIDDFREKYGDSLEVVNWGGMTVQGRHMRGINDRVVGELDPLIGVRQQILGLAGGPGGTQEMRTNAAAKLAAGIKERVERITAVNRYLVGPKGKTGSTGLRRDVLRSIKSEGRKGMTWQQAVTENERRIGLIQDNNADLSNAPEGVSYGNLGGADGVRRRNQKLIDDLRDEISYLKTKRPKGGSARRKRSLYDQLRGVNREHEVLTGEDTGKGEAGFRGALREQVAQWKISSTENADSLRRIGEVLIPTFGLDVDRLLKEKAELTGTSVKSPSLRPGSSAGADARQEEVNTLLKQENQQLRRANLLANLQFGTLGGFQGLAAGRMLGSFMTGGTTEGPGLALVHANERLTVDADPEGPFGNRAAMRGRDGRMEVELVVKLDEGGLLRIVDARVAGKAAGVTSRRLGREARIIAAAPGR